MNKPRPVQPQNDDVPLVKHGRAALAEAIADMNRLNVEAKKATDSLTRARDRVTDATKRLQQAQSDTARARNAETSRAVSAARDGGVITSDTAMRDARLREMDEQDGLEIAQAALATLEEDGDEPVRAASKARGVVEQAAKAVCLAELPRLREGVMKAAIEHYRQAKAFAFVASLFSSYDYNNDRLLAQNFAGRHAVVFDADHGEIDQVGNAATLPWREALDALQRVAGTSLPNEEV